MSGPFCCSKMLIEVVVRYYTLWLKPVLGLKYLVPFDHPSSTILPAYRVDASMRMSDIKRVNQIDTGSVRPSYDDSFACEKIVLMRAPALNRLSVYLCVQFENFSLRRSIDHLHTQPCRGAFLQSTCPRLKCTIQVLKQAMPLNYIGFAFDVFRCDSFSWVVPRKVVPFYICISGIVH